MARAPRHCVTTRFPGRPRRVDNPAPPRVAVRSAAIPRFRQFRGGNALAPRPAHAGLHGVGGLARSGNGAWVWASQRTGTNCPGQSPRTAICTGRGETHQRRHGICRGPSARTAQSMASTVRPCPPMSLAHRRTSWLNSAPRAEDRKRLQRPRREAGTARRHSDAATRTFPNTPSLLVAADIGTGRRSNLAAPGPRCRLPREAL